MKQEQRAQVLQKHEAQVQQEHEAQAYQEDQQIHNMIPLPTLSSEEEEEQLLPEDKPEQLAVKAAVLLDALQGGRPPDRLNEEQERGYWEVSLSKEMSQGEPGSRQVTPEAGPQQPRLQLTPEVNFPHHRCAQTD